MPGDLETLDVANESLDVDVWQSGLDHLFTSLDEDAPLDKASVPLTVSMDRHATWHPHSGGSNSQRLVSNSKVSAPCCLVSPRLGRDFWPSSLPPGAFRWQVSDSSIF
jgi:hypothetical protein